MKRRLLTVFLSFSLITVFGQNGLKNGNLFLLLKDKNTLSINSYSNRIKELNTFPITENSIYTTDQKQRVAIIDTVTKQVTIFGLKTNKIQLVIPYNIHPKSIFLDENNLFIGGEMNKAILIQYHLKSEKWYQLEIPNAVDGLGKAIDDFVVNDSLLIAIDNLVMPKYVLFYQKNETEKLELSHFIRLKNNGPYEHIHQGRITEKYVGLLSDTYSGYFGAMNHITIYNNLYLTSSFSLSAGQPGKNYLTFTDFMLVEDKLVIASKEKGLGIFELKESYFSTTDEFSDKMRNRQEDILKINFTEFENQVIIKLTLIPQSTKIVLTLEDKNGKLQHKIIDL